MNDPLFGGSPNENLLARIAGEMRTDMAEYEVKDVPGSLSEGVKRGDVHLQGCVIQAKSYFVAHSDLEGIAFVVGACYTDRGRGFAYGHAWVEVGTVVFDGVRQRFFDTEGYYKAMKAVPVRRLAGEEADVFLLRLEGDVWAELLAPLKEKYGNSLFVNNETGRIAFSFPWPPAFSV